MSLTYEQEIIMQFSSSARKAVAAGLALSTLVWSVSFFVLPFAFAAPHSNGCLVNASGTVWKIENGTRRGFTSGEVFLSHGYNFSQVLTANAEDTALPVGPIIVYADGTLVKGPSDPLVYLVANSQKRGFVSGSVFTGLGFSFANIQSAAVNTFADLPTGANLESATERHGTGVLVKDGSGTVWQMTATGRKGIPTMEVFASYGFNWNHVVAANAADLAATNEGVLTARTICSEIPGPNQNVNASIASSNPAASTLVTGQSTAHLADFMFSGSGTVTGITLKRTGISQDSTLSNVYLFDGATRLTDAASVSGNSLINFSNASGIFNVSGSKVISVKADLAGAAGETVGVSLQSATLSSGTVGGLPVSGNNHTLATATLAGVAVGAPLPSSAATTDPQNDVRVWESTFSVTTRDVVFSRLALRQINSIQTSDIKNFRLLVDGTQVASQQSLDANGYVTFGGFSKTLMTGSRNVKVLADVTGGSSRIIQMSLRNKADVDVKDSQYNVNVSVTGTIPASTNTLTVNPGTMTVQKANDSAAGNVTVGASDISLGRFNFTAYGEPIKVETLLVDFTYDGSPGATNNAAATLRNGKIMVNGTQVGSTTTLNPASTGTSFTTNFTVNPGTPALVEIKADIFDNDGTGAIDAGDTILTTLSQGTANGSRLVSLGTVAVPSANVNGGTVTAADAAITLAAQSNYPNQTVVIPRTGYKMGAWNLTGGNTEDINIHTFSLDIDPVTNATFSHLDLTDCMMKYGANQTSVKSSVVAADNDWSVTFSLPKNAVVTIELWCNIGATITALDSVKTDLTVTGTAATSGATVTQADKDGQTIIAGTGSLTRTLDASSPVAAITEDNTTKSGGAWKFSAANDDFTISEVVVDMAGASTCSMFTLKNGSNVIGTRPCATADVTFSGISVPVTQGNPVVLTAELTLGNVGSGAGTSREDVTLTMDSFKYRNSQGSETTEGTNSSANQLLVFRSIPVVTLGSVSNATPTNSESEIYKWTVAATGGDIAVKQFGLKLTVTDVPTTAGTLTLGSFKLLRGGTDITSSVTIRDQAGNDVKSGGSTFDEADTAVYVTFNTEEAISGSYEYVLRATPAGFLASDDDSFKVEMLQDSSSTRRQLGDVDETAAEIIATLSGGADASEDALPNYLIWSDNSAAAHDSTIPQDTAGDPAPTSSSDWTNSYLVKNLPLSSVTFTF